MIIAIVIIAIGTLIRTMDASDKMPVIRLSHVL